MKLASYKGTRPGFPGLFNVATRAWLHGPYSHTELVFSDGMCASSSFLDGGVRFKRIDLDPAKWDLVDCPGDEAYARAWFKKHDGEPFDVLGLIGFVGPRGLQNQWKWFCSESIGAALQIPQPWRLDTCVLPIVVQQRVK